MRNIRRDYENNLDRMLDQLAEHHLLGGVLDAGGAVVYGEETVELLNNLVGYERFKYVQEEGLDGRTWHTITDTLEEESVSYWH